MSFDIDATFVQMAEEKKITDPALAGFYEAMEKTNAEKIANGALARLSGSSSSSESFDVESESEGIEDRPWRPSHGKSTIMQSQIESMKGKYFHDVSIVRARERIEFPCQEAMK